MIKYSTGKFLDLWNLVNHPWHLRLHGGRVSSWQVLFNHWGGRKQTPSLMAGSYGFQSQEELLRVQKYLKDHGVWQLKQVS